MNHLLRFWSSAVSNCLLCPPDWIINETFCYKVFGKPVDYLTMPDAYDACERMNSTLIIARTAAELDFLYKIFKTNGYPNLRSWVI